MIMLYKKVANSNENLLSFICGIISNIPITFLLSFISYGETIVEKKFFYYFIAAFVLSGALMCFSFAFTTKVLTIRKKADQMTTVTARAKQFDIELEKIENCNFLRKNLRCFIIFALLFIATIIRLWLLKI